jgi:hypothetical protein
MGTTENTAYIGSLGWSDVERMKFNARATVMKYAQSILSRFPRKQSSEKQTKSVMFIIVAVGIITVIRCIAKYYQSLYETRLMSPE